MLAELRKQLARDRTKVTVSGFTQLGLVEMTRKRTRESLAHMLCEPCPTCQGRGEVKTARSVCYDILREILREARQFNPKEFRVVASAAVVEMLLDEESQHLAGLSRLHRQADLAARRADRLAGAVRHRAAVSGASASDGAARSLRPDLVICTRQIGDVLLTTPLIHAARERWPEAAIDVLGFGGTLGMLRGNPDVGALIEVPARQRLVRRRGADRRLWRRYDLALIAAVLATAPTCYGFAAARRRAGLVTDDAAGVVEAAAARASRVAMNDDQSHSVIREAAPARAVGRAARRRASSRRRRRRCRTDSRARSTAAVRRPAGAGRGGATSSGRSRTGASSSRALLERGLQVVLTGAPSAGDERAVVDVGAQRLRRGRASSTPPAGSTSARSPTLLRGAALYVGGDTSITHLAAACDVAGRRAVRADQPALLRAAGRANPTLERSLRRARARAARGKRRRAAGNAGRACRATAPAARTATTARSVCLRDDGAGARRRRGRPHPGFGRAPLNDNEAMSAGRTRSATGGHGPAGEGRHPGRRPRHAHLRGDRTCRPKPMIEIGGRPILWHIMKIYSAHGVNDFVICCGYKGYVIKEYFANYFLHMSDVTFDMAHNQMEVHQQQRRAVAGDAGRHRRGHA